jgi:putative oxidoreductase
LSHWQSLESSEEVETMKAFLGRYEGAIYALFRIVMAFLYWSHGPAWLFGAFVGRDPVPLTTKFGVAGTIEIVCGTLIAIGLFTSWAAFIASGEMAVAYFIAHVPRGSWMPIVNMGEITVALCFAFLYIAARGAGPFSIDALRGKGK